MTVAAEGENRWVLTGGIASGKTTVAGMFSELGAAILDADQAAREVVKPEASGWRKLREHFGPDYFDGRGGLLRHKLRQRIVADPECRNRVNQLLHPEILRQLDRAWAALREAEPNRPILFDLPLLFEAGLESRFTSIILVYVPASVQVRRLMHRDHLSRREAEATLLMQLPIGEKRARSDWVIDNTGSVAQTRRQVAWIWEHFKQNREGP